MLADTVLCKGENAVIISTKGRYALRVMIDLAEHRGEGYIPLKNIANRQGISEKYLEAILKALVKERFIIGLRGKGGGYKLSREPEEYTVGSIIRLAEGELVPVTCLSENAAECPRSGECRTIGMWREFGKVIDAFLDGYTIADLMEHPNREL